ncbi:MAG TPA: putative Ig domain-containing protein [Candidatus Dormibacteraeota bacterium]|nr:putative Ig domain-containing protein [Candidatus Dormibacteraeota bacterium]
MIRVSPTRRPRISSLLAALGTTLWLGAGATTQSGCSDCDLRVSTRMLPNATVGIRYDVPLTSNCGGDAWFLQTGTLPPGIGLEEDGDLAGIPTLAGTYTFTVAVVDFPSGSAAFKGLSITVDSVAPTPTATPG